MASPQMADPFDIRLDGPQMPGGDRPAAFSSMSQEPQSQSWYNQVGTTPGGGAGQQSDYQRTSAAGTSRSPGPPPSAQVLGTSQQAGAFSPSSGFLRKGKALGSLATNTHKALANVIKMPGFFDQFPTYFTLIVVGCFLTPMITMFREHSNINVQYWVGNWCLLAVVPIVIILAVHLIHSSTGMPNRAAVVAATFVPCIMFFVLAGEVSLVTGTHAMHLGVNDCTTFGAKRELDQSLMLAKALWASCLYDAQADDPAAAPKFWLCPNVRAHKKEDDWWWNDDKYHDDQWHHWVYLQKLEQTYKCGGFCDADRMFWTKGTPVDSCSVAASQDLQSVSGASGKIYIMMLFLFAFFLTGYMRASNEFWERGIKW